MLNRLSTRTCLTAAAIAVATTAGIVGVAKAQEVSRSLWMYNGETLRESAYLYAGESVYGACDSDCSDLDLFLYDMSGNVVSSDTLMDAVPIVTAPSEGNYVVEVTMPSCNHEAGCGVELSSDHGF